LQSPLPPPPAIHLAALTALQALLTQCPDSSLGGSGPYLQRVLSSTLCCRSSALVRGGGGVLLRTILRPAVLLEIYGKNNASVSLLPPPPQQQQQQSQQQQTSQTSSSTSASSSSVALATAERDLTRNLHHWLLEAQPPLPAEVRCSLLAAAVGLVGPGRLMGRETVPLLVLLVLGCLGGEERQLRAAACAALESLTASAGVEVCPQRLLLEGPLAPLVLHRVGCSVLQSPRLLPELCRLTKLSEASVVRAALPHAIGPLCCGNKLPELRALARLVDMTPSELFTLHAHHAYAYAFWKEAQAFEAFIDAVDELMDEPHGHQRVLGNVSMARIVTKQTIIMAGEPSADWASSPSLEPPPSAINRIQTFMQVVAGQVADMQSDDPVQEFVVGELTANLFELFGKQLSLAPGAGGGGGGGALSRGHASSATAVAGGGSPPSRGVVQHQNQGVRGGGAPRSSTHWLMSADSAEAEALQALRSLSVLVVLLGHHLPGHMPPVMVLLTAAVSRAAAGGGGACEELQLQSLAAWRVFLRCLSSTAPALLERVAVQASVVLLPLLQSPRGEVSRTAAAVLTLLVVDNLPYVMNALSRMPPLPTDVPGLERVAAVLQEKLQLADGRKRLRQLTDSLQHESLAVRGTS
ncbi:hypothetical protein Vafri_15148, partial [Volvox africanus]